MQTRYIVALGISSSKIKGAIASLPVRQDGDTAAPITVEIIEETPTLTASVQHGRIQNIIDTAKGASYIIDELGSRISDKGVITGLYTSVGGRSLYSEHVHVSVSLPDTTEITQEYVDRLKVQASAQISPERDVLAIIPTGYEVDDVPQINPVGTMGNRISGDFTVVTCNVANKRNLEKVIDERLNLLICDTIVSPLAEADLVLSAEERQIGCVFIDLGAETTTVAVYKNGVLQYIATLPLGSRNITRDIAMGMGITEERAEQMKLTLGNAIEERPGDIPGSEADKLNAYVRARAGEIVANIIAQISASGFQPSDLPGGCIAVGSGIRLRNFNALLSNQSKMQVRTGTCGPEFRMADGSVSIIDNIDILAMIYHAARTSDYICIESVAERQAATAAEEENPFRAGDGETDYINIEYTSGQYNEDDTLLEDDEVIESRKIKAQDDANRKLEEEKRRKRNADLAARERIHAQEQLINGDAPLEAGDEPSTTTSIAMGRINKIKEKIISIFTETADDDAVLDDEDEPRR